MDCENCGRLNKPTARFCVSCGEEFDVDLGLPMLPARVGKPAAVATD